MARNTSILLSDHYLKFIESKVASGEYASVSEMVRQGLRLLEQEEIKLQRLRDELHKGLNSGTVKDFDPEMFLKKIKAERR